MKRGTGIKQSSQRAPRPGRRRRPFLLTAVLASLALHLLLGAPILIPATLFAAKAPPPDPIPVEIVTLPPKPAEEPPPPPEPPTPQQAPEPPPRPVQLPPPQPPPPVTPQQIVIATRDVATPPQGDEKPNAAPEKPEPEQKPEPMQPAEEPQETKPEPPQPAPEKPEPPKAAEAPKPEPPKPEPPKPAPRAEPPKPEPPPERQVTGAIALARPQARPRDQLTGAEHRMPPMVVRPQPPGRMGNSLMPSYPSAARANGLQGRVVLLVTLSEQGRPRRIDIARSSGYDQLDESAVRAVWQWRFYRTDSGPPAEATIEIPLDFRL